MISQPPIRKESGLPSVIEDIKVVIRYTDANRSIGAKLQAPQCFNRHRFDNSRPLSGAVLRKV
jgi:hypothetical protein